MRALALLALVGCADAAADLSSTPDLDGVTTIGSPMLTWVSPHFVRGETNTVYALVNSMAPPQALGMDVGFAASANTTGTNPICPANLNGCLDLNRPARSFGTAPVSNLPDFVGATVDVAVPLAAPTLAAADVQAWLRIPNGSFFATNLTQRGIYDRADMCEVEVRTAGMPDPSGAAILTYGVIGNPYVDGFYSWGEGYSTPDATVSLLVPSGEDLIVRFYNLQGPIGATWEVVNVETGGTVLASGDESGNLGNLREVLVTPACP